MWNIAFNTYRELLRSRALLISLFFGGISVLITPFLKTLSLGQTQFIVPHFSFTFFEWCLVMLTLFLGSSLLAKEIESRTLYLLLSKPISRSSILFGKFLGCAGIIMVSGVIMSAILAGAFYFSGAPWDYFFLVVAAIIIKTMVTWSFLLFLSTFASPFVSLFVTISMYISAHGVYVLLDLSRSPQMPHLREIAQILSYLLPNFEALSQIKGFVGFPEIVPQSQNFFGLFVPAILYAIILLIAAALVFQKRKFQ